MTVLLLKAGLFTLVIPGTVAVYLPLLVAPERILAGGAAFAMGVAVTALGAAIYAWCVWDFAAFGRGTPMPLDPPPRLVIRGLYRYTRNPMYVGVLTVILGQAVMFGAMAIFGYSLCVAAGFHLFVVLYEEPHLRRQFGTDYEDYCTRVHRWLPRAMPLS